MAAPLSDEERQRYTHLIDAILSTADLLTVSRKKVRKGLEKALGGKDLSDQKVAIKGLIEARFDAMSSAAPPENNNIPTPPQNNSHHHHHDYRDENGQTPVKREHSAISGDEEGHRSSTDREINVVSYEDDDDDDNRHNHQRPATKKHKRSSSSVEDADARLAAELQAQENRLARARTTRGGGSTSKASKAGKPRTKRTPKKKSAAKVKDGDDSGADSDASGSVVKEKRKASGGFQKPFNLSFQLTELVGESQLPRPQVVKKLWEYIKGHDLQDPSDKRQIRCDDKMQAVFKQQRVDMFQMNKLLGNHLYPVDEE